MVVSRKGFELDLCMAAYWQQGWQVSSSELGCTPRLRCFNRTDSSLGLGIIQAFCSDSEAVIQT